MTEKEFIKFYKRRNLSRNYKEAKDKIDLFWSALLKALDEDGKVTLKDWGVFEKKEIAPRRIVTPQIKEAVFTKAKKKKYYIDILMETLLRKKSIKSGNI